MQLLRAGEAPHEGPTISAVVLAHNRRDAVARNLHHLKELPVNEVIVVDNASTDGTADVVNGTDDPRVRLVRSETNLGVGGRNLGVAASSCDLLLLVDDDSFPLPGAIEKLVAAITASDRVGVVGGFIHDKDRTGAPLEPGAVGTFDWWLRAGATGPAGPSGFPSTYFPECGCLIRRDAYLDAGGFFEPYFFHISEPDLAIRMLAKGWDVRYLPEAEFEHAKEPRGGEYVSRNLRFRVRNRLWFCWRHYPADVALRRALGFALLDIAEAIWLRAPAAFVGGAAAAWRERDAVRGTRRPIARQLVGRADLGTGRMQARFLAWMIARKLLRRRR